MPLQKKEIEILLTGGIDEKSGDEVAEQTSNQNVVNLRWDSAGQFEKRPTYASTTSASGISGSNYSDESIECLLPRGSEVWGLTADLGVTRVAADDPTAVLYSRRENNASETPTAAMKWSPRACRVSRRFIDRAQLGTSSAGVHNLTAAVYGNTLVTAWVEIGDETRVRMKAVDVDTGRQLGTVETKNISGTTTYPRAIPYTESGKEGVLIAFTSTASAPYTIETWRWVAASRHFVADSNLATDADNPYFSLANEYSGDEFYFAYEINPGEFMTVQRRTISTVGAVHTTLHSCGQGTAIVVGSTNVLILSVDGNSTLFAEVFGAPLSVMTALSASSETFHKVAAAREQHSGTDYAVAFVSGTDQSAPTSDTGKRITRIVSLSFAGGTVAVESSGSATVTGAVIAADAVTFENRAYGVFTTMDQISDTAETLTLARYATHSFGGARMHAVARLCHDRAFSHQGSLAAGYSGAAMVVSGNRIVCVASADPGEDRAPVFGSMLPQSIAACFVAFVNGDGVARPLPHVQLSNKTLACSGLLMEWDGDTPSEHQPLEPPRVIVENGGGTGPTGTFRFCAIYRWVDASGELHRSEPTVATLRPSITVTDDTISVYVSRAPFFGYDVTWGHEMEPELYVTDDDGTDFFLLNESNAKIAWDSTSDGNGDWYRFDIDFALSGVTSNPPLYSTGSASEELTSEPAPAFQDICQIQDRLWAIDAEDRTRVWFTKPLASGFAPEWNTVNTLVIGDNGVAIVDANGVPTVLCERGVYQVFGEGPNANGVGFFAPARRTPHEVSCVDSCSIAKVPQGIFFRSRRGFQLLTNGVELVSVGMPIDPSTRLGDRTSAYQYTKAIYDELHNEVRVIDATASTYWCFNLVENKWSRWTQIQSAQNAIDLAVVDGQVWYVHYNGSATSIRREYAADESNVVASSEGWSMQSKWVRLDGVAGYGRLWEIVLVLDEATNKSNVNALTVSVEYKSSEAVTGSEAHSWTGSEISAMGVSNLRIKPSQQRVRAFRLTISETCSGVTSGSVPIVARAILGVDGKAIKQTRGTNSPKGTA